MLSTTWLWRVGTMPRRPVPIIIHRGATLPRAQLDDRSISVGAVKNQIITNFGFKRLPTPGRPPPPYFSLQIAPEAIVAHHARYLEQYITQEAYMNYSGSGLKFTEQFEGLRLTAYQDQVGVWTCGYGHTGKDVYPGLTITQLQAEQLLLQDVQHAVNAVNHLVTFSITQSEFDALVDLVFNIGSGNFAGSTLLKKLNSGDIPGAADEFQKWDKAGSQVVAGLLRRRIAEAQEFRA